jgi:hypothetical protein
VAVHHRVAVRIGGREARGVTENLSERGTMLSVEIEPPLVTGDVVRLAISLPDGATMNVGGVVRWVSTVLPGMVGVEFEPPIPAALAEYVERMLADLFPKANVG